MQNLPIACSWSFCRRYGNGREGRDNKSNKTKVVSKLFLLYFKIFIKYKLFFILRKGLLAIGSKKKVKQPKKNNKMYNNKKHQNMERHKQMKEKQTLIIWQEEEQKHQGKQKQKSKIVYETRGKAAPSSKMKWSKLLSGTLATMLSPNTL